MSYTIPQLQFMQLNLRNTIRDIQEDIVSYKLQKSLHDRAGNLDEEYAFHNLLQAAKRELKKYVGLQMATKQMLRDAYGDNRLYHFLTGRDE